MNQLGLPRSKQTNIYSVTSSSKMTDVLDASISSTPSAEWVHIGNSASNDCYGSSRVPSPSIRSVVSSTGSREPSDQDAAFSHTHEFDPKELSGLHPGGPLRPRVNAAQSRDSEDKVNGSLFPQEPTSGTDSVTGGSTSQEHGQKSSDSELLRFLAALESELEVSKNSRIGRTPPPTAPSPAGRGQSKEGQKASTEVYSDAAKSLSGWPGRGVDANWLDGYEGDLPEPDGSM